MRAVGGGAAHGPRPAGPRPRAGRPHRPVAAERCRLRHPVHAAATIGAVTVPLNTRWKAPEIAFALRRAGYVAVFAVDRFLSQDFRAHLLEAEPVLVTGLRGGRWPLCAALRHVVFLAPEAPTGALCWDDIRARDAGEQALAAAVTAARAEDDLLLQFPCGTTAHPKGVLLTHQPCCATPPPSVWASGRRTATSTAGRSSCRLHPLFAPLSRHRRGADHIPHLRSRSASGGRGGLRRPLRQ